MSLNWLDSGLVHGLAIEGLFAVFDDENGVFDFDGGFEAGSGLNHGMLILILIK